jgi:hypothetical protein
MLSGSECGALVAPHQAGVADNVCGEDRRQFALLTGHGRFPAFVKQCSADAALTVKAWPTLPQTAAIEPFINGMHTRDVFIIE